MTGIAANIGSVQRFQRAMSLSRRLGASVFDGAAAAYSLRIPHGSTYSGPLIRVRRSSDNVELDIGAASTPQTRQNWLPSLAGAVVGSPGTLPTAWSPDAGTPAGLTRTVVGVGTTADGLPYFDLRFAGTPSAGGTLRQNLSATTVGAPFTANGLAVLSVGLQIAGGSLTNVGFGLRISSRNTSGGLNDFRSAGITPTTASSRITFSTQFIGSVGLIAHPELQMFYSAGAALDVTLRITCPNIETGVSSNARPLTTTALTVVAGVGNLDIDALNEFVGGGSGFVTTWYDQAGNGRNAVQSSGPAQPRIVNAGAVETVGGLPALVFSAAQCLITPTVLSRTAYPNAFVSCVYQTTSTTNTAALWGGDGGTWPRFQLLNFALSPSISWGASSGSTAIQQTALMANNNRHVYSYVSRAGVANGSCVFIDGATGVALTESGNGAPTALTIGAITPTGVYPMTGNVQEFVYGFYAPTTTQRQALERSQGAAFGITVA